MDYIFVYGTLMSDYIYNTVTRNTERHESSNATLINYTRVCIKNKIYPAIIKQNSGIVNGILKKVPKEHLSALDEFEGEEYQRELLEVSVSGTIVKAWTYVWSKSHQELEMKEWNFNNFLLSRNIWQKETI